MGPATVEAQWDHRRQHRWRRGPTSMLSNHSGPTANPSSAAAAIAFSSPAQGSMLAGLLLRAQSTDPGAAAAYGGRAAGRFRTA